MRINMGIGTRINTNLFLGNDILYELVSSLVRSFLPKYAKPVEIISIDHKTRYSNIIKENNANIIQDFIRAGAKVNQFDPHSKTTPIIEAAASGYLQSVHGLIKAGASLSLTDELHYRTPLEWAFFHGHSKVSTCLLDNMSPEQIHYQVNHRPSRLPSLNAFIETHQLEKLQQQLFAITPQNQENSPFTGLPTELLFHIFSFKYPTLTAEQILQKINLVFNAVANLKEKEVTELEVKNQLLIEDAPKPVVFSAIETIEITQNSEQRNNLKMDLETKNKNKLK